MDDEAASRLQELEESLWRTETRYDEAWMRRVLHPDFLEFGRSGRVYDLAASLAVEPGVFEAELPLAGFTVVEPAPRVALATYRSRVRYEEGVLAANRSSLWIHDGAAWRLRFHQGTPV